MSIQIKTKDTDKYGRPEYAYISVEVALELYEGGLYKLLQSELGIIQLQTERNKKYTQYLRELTKKCEQLGIKQVKAGNND
jgi:hypothetical protein